MHKAPISMNITSRHQQSPSWDSHLPKAMEKGFRWEQAAPTAQLPYSLSVNLNFLKCTSLFFFYFYFIFNFLLPSCPRCGETCDESCRICVTELLWLFERSHSQVLVSEAQRFLSRAVQRELFTIPAVWICSKWITWRRFNLYKKQANLKYFCGSLALIYNLKA